MPTDPTGEMPALTLERIAELRKRARPRLAEKQRSIHCDDLAVLCDLAERALKRPVLTREQVWELCFGYNWHEDRSPAEKHFFREFSDRMKQLGIEVEQ